MKKEGFYDLLESIPKAELHVHEEAVLSRETVKKVYKRNFNQDMSDKEFRQFQNLKKQNQPFYYSNFFRDSDNFIHLTN